MSGSLVIDAGFNFAASTSDQRGTPFVWTFGTSTDMGAVEVQTFPSSVVLAADKTTVAVADMLTLTATVAALDNVPAPTGTVTFVDTTSGAILGSAPLVGAVATLMIAGSSLVTGVNAIVAQYSGDTNFDAGTSVPVPVTLVKDPIPAGSAFGAGSGSGAAQLFTSDGTQLLSMAPFGESFTGGIRVASGDFNNDGVVDLAVGAEPGGSPRVVALSGQDLLPGISTAIASFFASDPSSANGVPISVNDIDGDGAAELLAAVGEPLPGTPPTPLPVTVYTLASIATGAPTPLTTLDPFPGFGGGIFVG